MDKLNRETKCWFNESDIRIDRIFSHNVYNPKRERSLKRYYIKLDSEEMCFFLIKQKMSFRTDDSLTWSVYTIILNKTNTKKYLLELVANLLNMYTTIRLY